MKKIIYCMLAMFTASVVNVYADGQSAMLVQGDSIQLFYGTTALSQAYAAADTTGAVITLSPGDFGNLTIEKNNIKIIGNYGFAYSSKSSNLSNLTIMNTENVIIDGLYIDASIILNNIYDCKIIHSRMSEVECDTRHINTIIDKCNVEGGLSVSNSQDFTIKNSIIYYFSGMNSENNPVYILNNVVKSFNTYNGYDSHCPNGIYKNNILKSGNNIHNNFNLTSPREYYYNLFIYETSNYNIYFDMNCIEEKNTVIRTDSILVGAGSFSHPNNPGIGMDGTVRGPQGGTGFTESPSIPRIVGRTIDSQPDEDGKINVKISVKAK